MSDFDTVPVNDVPADAVILDVREDYEWVAGHAEDAIHIPLDQLPSRLDELDPDQDLYVI
jgi:rhodanese-related sulfurtransferase